MRPEDPVGRYQVRREIGRGGFGAVDEAFDPEFGRTVAPWEANDAWLADTLAAQGRLAEARAMQARPAR